MAQTGFTPILIYSSSTASQAPAAGNLTNSTLGSELAINITDGKLFYKDNANVVQVIGWKTTPTTAGGTGLTSYAAGDLLYYATGTTLSKLPIGSNGNYLSSSGTAPQWSAPAALTKTNDTNVTLTLGGNASTALLNAASLTLGWTGQLAVTRGGTGLSTVAQGDILYGSASNTLAALAKNTTATRYLANTGTNNNPAWAQINLADGVTGTLGTGNGGTGLTSFTANALVYSTSTSALTTSANLYFNGSNFGIGGTPNELFSAFSSSAASYIQLANSGTGTASTDGFFVGAFNANAEVRNKENGTLTFWTNNTERGRFNTTLGEILVGTTSTNGYWTGAGSIIKNDVNTVNTKMFEVVGFDAANVPGFAVFYGANGGTPNTANATVKVGQMNVTGRSINAAGTINASGADYAEYMQKNGDFQIAKGDVCGIDANGLLTNKYDEAISFVVKSTNPSYVGNDAWGNATVLGREPQMANRKENVYDENRNLIEPGESDEEYELRLNKYNEELQAFQIKYENERQKFDRIAFCGQVPVNVKNATVGGYVLPNNNGGLISAVCVVNPSYEQYVQSVGKVIKQINENTAVMIVKIS